MTRSQAFSGALRRTRQLYILTWSFDWFTGLFVSFVIGSSDYFRLD